MTQDNKIVNEAMISENNSNKLLRILREDISKFCFCLGGTVAACFLPGVWGMAIPAIPFFGGVYYGIKAICRANRVANEDKALSKLEQKSHSAAQKEVIRQNHLLNNLETSSQNLEKSRSEKKLGLLRRLKNGVKSCFVPQKQKNMD